MRDVSRYCDSIPFGERIRLSSVENVRTECICMHKPNRFHNVIIVIVLWKSYDSKCREKVDAGTVDVVMVDFEWAWGAFGSNEATEKMHCYFGVGAAGTSTHFVSLQKDYTFAPTAWRCVALNIIYFIIHGVSNAHNAHEYLIMYLCELWILNARRTSIDSKKMEWMNRLARICGLEFNADIDTYRSIRLFVRVPHVLIRNRTSLCVASRFLTIQRQQNC